MDDEKRKHEVNQMFNLVEAPLMEYISKFLDELPEIIFNSDPSFKVEPLILLPIPEYKKDIYLEFSLQTVNKNTFKSKIPNLIKFQNVKDTIGFFVYCVNSVYPSIISSSMINKKTMTCVDLQLNTETWTFNPIYTHELNIRKKLLEDKLSLYIHMMKTCDKDKINEVNVEYNKIIKEISSVNKEINKLSKITSSVTEKETIPYIESKINKSYDKKPVLAIKVRELKKSQLPKK